MIRAVVRNEPLAIALLVSAVFHLSMVSVFSIVLYFPRHDLEYYSVQIVEQRPVKMGDSAQTAEPAQRPPERTPATAGALRVPSPDGLLADEDGDENDLLADATLPEGWGDLPPIQLPKLEFAGMDLLRTREESLRIRAEYSDLFERKPKDSWARFSDQLRGLGTALTGLGPQGLPELASDSAQPKKVSSPAPGFAVYIEWMSEPTDRELLFSPPIQTLWSVEPSNLARPVVLAFTVNPQGKVIDVQIPIEDEEGVASEIAATLLKYRFDVLQGPNPRDQIGTLVVAAEQAEE